jgi:hypothetical protein
VTDARTPLEKTLWSVIGPPLYYCANCLKAVDVKPVEGGEPIITRQCQCAGQIMAPRKAIAAGEGGLNFSDSVRMKTAQLMAALTGRCV